jgi:hypothetical protein
VEALDLVNWFEVALWRLLVFLEGLLNSSSSSASNAERIAGDFDLRADLAALPLLRAGSSIFSEIFTDFLYDFSRASPNNGT